MHTFEITDMNVNIDLKKIDTYKKWSMTLTFRT